MSNKQFTIKKPIIGLLLSILLVSCAGQPSSQAVPASDHLQGGILATFAVGNQQFHVWVTNPAAVQQILDLQAGNSPASYLDGVIQLGPGESQFNAPYGWHLDPQSIQMVASKDASCNATPIQVQSDLKKYADGIHHYCPANAVLIGVQDDRLPAPKMDTA